MDVIRLYSIGVKNVVALMGTALTKDQISLIKRLSKNIILCLDGDQAGKKAMNSVGEDLTNAGLNVSVVVLKEDLDPDEYVIKYGKDSFISLCDNPISYSEYKILYMREGLDLNDLDTKTAYINNALKEIKQENDLIKQEFLLKKIAVEFDIDISILRNNLKKVEKYSKIEALNAKPAPKNKLTKYQKATYDILYTIMNNYEACKYYEKHLNFLPYKNARYLANEIIYTYKINGKLVLADFITSLHDKPELLQLVKDILKNVSIEQSNLEAFKDYIAVIHDYNKNQEIDRLKKLMNEESDSAIKAKYLEQIRLVKIGSESND